MVRVVPSKYFNVQQLEKGNTSRGIWSLLDPVDFMRVQLMDKAGMAVKYLQSELVHLLRHQQDNQIMAPELLIAELAENIINMVCGEAVASVIYRTLLGGLESDNF